jgi:hypothetical protein
MVERSMSMAWRMILPEAVQGVEDDMALEPAERLWGLDGLLEAVDLPDAGDYGVPHGVDVGFAAFGLELEDVLLLEADGEGAVEPEGERLLVDRALGLLVGDGDALLDLALDLLLDEGEDDVARILVEEHLLAEAVDHFALLVHDVVVFEGALADGEVVLLDPALGGLDGLVQPGMLELFALLEAEALHDLDDAVGAEEAHEVVFERDEEAG